tara:strand:+ start:2212 stop:3579 length:1368 start_codon:yes stop_codon:yes gene_type:complete
MGKKRPWYDRPYSAANRTSPPKAPRLNVIEGGKEIAPSDPTNKPKTGLSFLGKTFGQIVGLGGRANVLTQILKPTPLSDGTIPEGWKPPSPKVDLYPQDIKMGQLDITVYAPEELPSRVDPAMVTMPPVPPSYYGDVPIKVDPRAPVVKLGDDESFYEPPSRMQPPQQLEFKKNEIVSFEDVHVGNPYRVVNNQVRRYSRGYESRWLGQSDVIITSTDYKPYDQAAAIAEYDAWLAEQNKIITSVDVNLQPSVLADGRVVNMIDEIWYKEEKLDPIRKPDVKPQFEKFTELTIELLTETKVTAQTRLGARAGSNRKRRRDGKSRYGEAYLALKRVIDATIGGELPELYFMFTDNLISKPMGRMRPPMRAGYLTFWDPRIQQWRYKAKTPWGIYQGYETGFLELDVEAFIIDLAYNFVEDALIGKVSRKAKAGHDSMLQQFGKTSREIGFAFGPTL